MKNGLRLPSVLPAGRARPSGGLSISAVNVFQPAANAAFKAGTRSARAVKISSGLILLDVR